ncbi:hypothetical protein CU097_007836 [Rhizopus azygosporus]|uniref:Uncharacterized protein n=1 Tax=Rhizopus azygosporus TaxID=86630 RepID=A0A367JR48_RHIAZ|nr:hypothetical protein CU097_007836 [Rhizopus azygosporus]
MSMASNWSLAPKFSTRLLHQAYVSTLISNLKLGPVTSNFILNAYERSFATKIFVKKSAWESAQHIARCERFNEPTDDFSTRPYTIFTLCKWDNGNNDSGYRVGSLLLQTIANNMITGRSALRKDDVDLLKSKVPRGIDMDKYIIEIIALFNNDDSIVIIDNTELNHILQKIARSLAPQIAKANESIVVTVKSIFSS